MNEKCFSYLHKSLLSTLIIVCTACSNQTSTPVSNNERTNNEPNAKLATKQSTKKTSTVSQSAEEQKLSDFFANSFQETLALSPKTQTYLGIKTDYDKWDDISPEAYLKYIDLRKSQLSTLKSTINFEALSPNSQLNYQLFSQNIELEIEGLDFNNYGYLFNQMRGLQSSIPAFLINMHKVDNEADAKAYISRLQRISPLMQQAIENFSQQIDKGIFLPKFLFAYLYDDINKVTSGHPFQAGEDNFLLTDFKKKVTALSLPKETQSQLIQQAESALLDHLLPAYKTLNETLKAAEPLSSSDAGAWKHPMGGKYYSYKLKQNTTTSLSAEEIHQIGLNEVKRIHTEMHDIMEQVGFQGSLQEFFSYLKTDSQFTYADSDQGRQEFLTQTQTYIDNIKSKIDELFIKQPKASLTVKRVEAFREKSAGKAFYQRPSQDGSRPGIYYVNLYDMASIPSYSLEALTYHEAIPGHHMQLALMIEQQDLPDFRKYSRYTAFTEGWGLYSEFIPKELGFYQDPYSDFGRLSMELWRACRLVVDTGMHAKQWSREQAIKYLHDTTPGSEVDIRKAIDRYIVMPGQATSYMIGKMKILELREYAKQSLGKKFDIRKFHDLVLANGPMPLSSLEDNVNKWVNNGGKP